MSHQHFLDDGKIELLVNRLRALGTERQELAEEIETEASYFERNARACVTRSSASSGCSWAQE